MSENITELLAEIERLRARVAELNATLSEIHAGNDRLCERITALEAELAVMRGSLAPHPADDEPGNYTHNVAPSAPR
jgi:uncharacterized coiled-coil protein SlyX